MKKVIVGIETSNWSIKNSEKVTQIDIVKIALLDVEDSTKVWSAQLLPIMCKDQKDNNLLASDAIKNFIHYLEENYSKGVVLVAHNGYKYEFPHLKRYIDKYYGTNCSLKWIDSAKILQKHFPALESYDLAPLMEKFGHDSYYKGEIEPSQHCLDIKKLIESASQYKNVSVEQFMSLCSPLPFSFITSPHVEKKVIIDLETNGFGMDCEILQIALVDIHNSSKYWNQYIQPTKPIHPKAAEVNHLSVGIDNRLCYREIECENVVSASEGIQKFLEYLKHNYPEGAILIAHNGATFDFPLLRRYLDKHVSNLSEESLSYQIMCIDSLWVFQKHYRGLNSYNQDYLIKRFPGVSSPKDAHDALGDCINLSNAIKSAALEKKLSLTQFLGELTRKSPIHSF